MNSNPATNANPNMVFQLRSLLQSAQSILIVLSGQGDEDTVAAGLGLYLSLLKIRKQITIIAPDDSKVERAHLVGINKIGKQLAGGSTLIVSIPYSEGAIEKASYTIENNRLNLVIEPRGEKLNFSINDIEYNYGKGEYDAIFTVGVSEPSQMGEVYQKHQNIFSQKPIVNIDRNQQNTQFGRINIVADAPISQTVALVLKSLHLPLDQDAASNLYTGIVAAQQGIQLEGASPDTLEAVAFLLRANARQLQKSNQPQEQKQQENVQPVQAQQQFQTPPQQQQAAPANDRSSDFFNKPAAQNPQQSQQPQQQEAPEDWLRPKIFTNRTLSNTN
ncbi:MAG TPA: hypothetical protein VJL83_03690 [Patescibacteria group bacterium]|nr:hypothetical protein [Patescibacteria group bacterium]